jgi:hypothetical protein
MTYPSFNPGDILFASDQNAVGLWKIATASATSGSSLSFDDCFTSDFATYLILLEDVRTTTAQGWNFRLRASGTDTVANYYDVRRGYIYTSDTPQISRVNNGANGQLACISDTNSASVTIYVNQAQKARVTNFTSKGNDSRTGGYGLFDSGGILNDTTVYDGFTVFHAGTTSNINATVYGYRL